MVDHVEAQQYSMAPNLLGAEVDVTMRAFSNWLTDTAPHRDPIVVPPGKKSSRDRHAETAPRLTRLYPPMRQCGSAPMRQCANTPMPAGGWLFARREVL